MITPRPDERSAERREKDEQIASQPALAPYQVAPGTRPAPVEDHLAHRRRPVAVAGVVENGLVRPLDPSIKLSEHSRVIIVASESS